MFLGVCLFICCAWSVHCTDMWSRAFFMLCLECVMSFWPFLSSDIFRRGRTKKVKYAGLGFICTYKAYLTLRTSTSTNMISSVCPNSLCFCCRFLGIYGRRPKFLGEVYVYKLSIFDIHLYYKKQFEDCSVWIKSNWNFKKVNWSRWFTLPLLTLTFALSLFFFLSPPIAFHSLRG